MYSTWDGQARKSHFIYPSGCGLLKTKPPKSHARAATKTETVEQTCPASQDSVKAARPAGSRLHRWPLRTRGMHGTAGTTPALHACQLTSRPGRLRRTGRWTGRTRARSGFVPRPWISPWLAVANRHSSSPCSSSTAVYGQGPDARANLSSSSPAARDPARDRVNIWMDGRAQSHRWRRRSDVWAMMQTTTAGPRGCALHMRAPFSDLSSISRSSWSLRAAARPHRIVQLQFALFLFLRGSSALIPCLLLQLVSVRRWLKRIPARFFFLFWSVYIAWLFYKSYKMDLYDWKRSELKKSFNQFYF
jgi:hypothetical protein